MYIFLLVNNFNTGKTLVLQLDKSNCLRIVTGVFVCAEIGFFWKKPKLPNLILTVNARLT